MNIIKSFDFYLEELKNACFPLKCLNCGKWVETEGICDECWGQINWFSEPRCSVCGTAFEINLYGTCINCIKHPPYFDKALSVFLYDNNTKKMILNFKHYDATEFTKIFAYWMYRIAEFYIKDADLIIPVPIHFLKRLNRLFNQSELLARELSRLTNTKYAPDVIEKTKETPPQEELDAKKRRKNLNGVFQISKKAESIENKNIILIDDVFTTGSTINECAKVLKQHGAKKITALTLARA